MDFFNHTYDEKLQIIEKPVLTFSFYKYISLLRRTSLHVRIYIIGLLIKNTQKIHLKQTPYNKLIIVFIMYNYAQHVCDDR